VQVQVEQSRRKAGRRSERGKGRLKNIIILVVIVLAIYSAIKIIPVYVNDYQLADKMQEVARFAVVNRYTEDQIRENVYKTVIDLNVPAKKEDIKVQSGSGVVRISLEYTVPVDLIAYRLELHFSPNSESKTVF